MAMSRSIAKVFDRVSGRAMRMVSVIGGTTVMDAAVVMAVSSATFLATSLVAAHNKQTTLKEF